MNIHDFSIAFQQKFDFNGKSYVFDKIDVSKGSELKPTTLGKYNSYTAEQQQNVMVCMSDAVCFSKTSTNQSGSVYESGEVVYLSTLLDKFSNQTVDYYFANKRILFNTQVDAPSSNWHEYYAKMAGTFYIFDFNDNPV